MRTPTDRFGETLHLTAHQWRLALDRRLRPLGFSRSGWLLLAYLSREDGISHGVLAERMGIEAATLVRLIDRMETDGHVQRRPGTTDRRVKLLYLTDSGRATAARIKSEAAALRGELLTDIEPAQLQATLDLLDQLHARLESLT